MTCWSWLILVIIWIVIMLGVVFISPMVALIGIAVYLLTLIFCTIER